ncbi:sugar transferase [Candidatus Thioglobus sp.]|nr:sugar transferase [Candidatus Thioglobus sp.]
MIRVFDFFLSIFGLVALSPVLVLLFLIGIFDTGLPLFRQTRIGRFEKPFNLVKFRTMEKGTPSVASHLTDTSKITKFGFFLRKTKLDELPQLWNVFIGDMSIVGPRPGLFNQQELRNARRRKGVFNSRPGITGLSQVSGIDMSTPELLAETDARMLETLSVYDYFKYIIMTATGKGQGDAANR